MTYLFNNEEITLEHTIFDAIVTDDNGEILTVFTQEQLDDARLKKAKFLLKEGQIKEVKAKAPSTAVPTVEENKGEEKAPGINDSEGDDNDEDQTTKSKKKQ